MDDHDEPVLSPEELFKGVLDSYNQFKKNVGEVRAAQNKCKSSIKQYHERVSYYKPRDEEEKKVISSNKREIKEMVNYLPKQNNMLLTLFLGDFNVVLSGKEEKLKYTRQYEKFKLWFIFGQLFLSSINILLGPSRITEGLLQFYLVWFYCNLTMKESILVANGSDIKLWWLVQHYLDIVLYAVMLVRSDGEFSLQFSLYIFYMSGTQILQFYYQSGSLYKLRALGRAEQMEVSAEGPRVKTFADLRFLFPFLFGVYIFQLYNSYRLMYLVDGARDDEKWEVALCALLFLAIALGNLYTIVKVIVRKWKMRYAGNNGYSSPSSSPPRTTGG